MPDAVVVELDRQLRPLDAEDLEELGLVGERLDGRQRLRHAAEGDPAVLALEPHRHDAAPGLEPDLLELHRRGEDECRPERGVPRERHLDRGREDADARVPVALRREHEHRLGEVQLARKPLHQLVVDLARVREDAELVALRAGCP